MTKKPSVQVDTASLHVLCMDSLIQATVFYGVSMLPILRAMDLEVIKTILSRVCIVSMENPLHYCNSPEFIISEWSDEKLTGGQVIALGVYGQFVLMGENPEMCRSLYDTWRIREALFICPKS